jgi:hypothetical protein
MKTTLRSSVLLAAIAVASCAGRLETALEKLSLGQKRELTAQCEATLRALQQALAKRGFGGTR